MEGEIETASWCSWMYQILNHASICRTFITSADSFLYTKRILSEHIDVRLYDRLLGQFPTALRHTSINIKACPSPAPCAKARKLATSSERDVVSVSAGSFVFCYKMREYLQLNPVRVFEPVQQKSRGHGGERPKPPRYPSWRHMAEVSTKSWALGHGGLGVLRGSANPPQALGSNIRSELLLFGLYEPCLVWRMDAGVRIE
jgi:hypothetical protein